eukprot:2334561-Alexandrium_andersonii.AAC.1
MLAEGSLPRRSGATRSHPSWGCPRPATGRRGATSPRPPPHGSPQRALMWRTTSRTARPG